MSACPIDGCSNRRSDGQMLCRSHWFKVPRLMRRKIWDAWRNDKLQEHLDLRDEAIAKIEMDEAADAAAQEKP